MPTCPRCGRPLAAPDAPFCAYCGQPINQPMQTGGPLPADSPIPTVAGAPQPQAPPYQPPAANYPPAFSPQAPPASGGTGTPFAPPYQPAPPAGGPPPVAPYYPYGQPQAPYPGSMPPPYGMPAYAPPLPGYPVAPFGAGVSIAKPVDATRGALLTAGLIGSVLLLAVIVGIILPFRFLLHYYLENILVNESGYFTSYKVLWVQGLILLTGWAGGAFWLALLRLRQVAAVQAWLEALGTTLVLMLAGNSLFLLLAPNMFVRPDGIGISFSVYPDFGRFLPLFFGAAFWITNLIAALALGSLGFLFALGFATWAQVRRQGQPSTLVRDYARVVPATFIVTVLTLFFTDWYGQRITDGIALLSLPLIYLSVWAYGDVMRVLRRDQPELFAPQAAVPFSSIPNRTATAMPFAITNIVLLGVAALSFFVLPRDTANALSGPNLTPATASVISSRFTGQLPIYGILAVVMMLAALGATIAHLVMLNQNSARGARLGLVIGSLAASVIGLIAVMWYDHLVLGLQIFIPFQSTNVLLPGPGIWLPSLLLITAIMMSLMSLAQEAKGPTP